MSVDMHWLMLAEPKTGLLYMGHDVNAVTFTHKRHKARPFISTEEMLEEQRQVRIIFGIDLQVIQ